MNDQAEYTEERLLRILEESILDEQASCQRYNYGMKIAKDEETRELFRQLVIDEMEHEKVLKKRYYEIKKRLGLKVMKGNDGEV